MDNAVVCPENRRPILVVAAVVNWGLPVTSVRMRCCVEVKTFTAETLLTRVTLVAHTDDGGLRTEVAIGSRMWLGLGWARAGDDVV